MAARLTKESVEVLATGTPNARLTKESVEVLAKGTPAARLTKISVEVLGIVTTVTEITLDISDTVTFSDSLITQLIKINTVLAEILFNFNILATGVLTKNATCTAIFSFNLIPAPSVEKNSSALLEFDFSLIPRAVKTIGASCTMTFELVFSLIGQSSAVKLDCIAGKDKLPSDPTTTGSSNSAYFS